MFDRRRARWTAAVAAILALGISACGGGPPQRVELSELAATLDDYDGRRVVLTGTVREFGPDEGALELHYVIEDAAQNRVELLPLETAAPFTDDRVTVTGVFSYDEDVGRRIEVEDIRPER